MLAIKTSKVALTDLYDEACLKRNITLSMLRLDLVHPAVSGNKIFKLNYFLKKAIELKLPIITFGGAWSNHLTATAAACRYYKLPCIGIVRGEQPVTLSASLLYCTRQNMQLEFIKRSAYREKQEVAFQHSLQAKFGDHILVPEGGFSQEGLRGAAEIYDHISGESCTHICCSVGTATTVAGLIKAAPAWQQILGFSALRELNFEERINQLLEAPKPNNCILVKDYHFGGYVKKSGDLINFMNEFYDNYGIPLDFVYTGKMMYGVFDLIRQDYFAENSRIICLHTGGLQGNSSLKPGVLKY